MVAPLWPPITGTARVLGSAFPPKACAANVEARTTSRVVTPKSRVGSNTPARVKVSAATGTVAFTGLVTTQQTAVGHVTAISSKISRMIEAFVCLDQYNWPYRTSKCARWNKFTLKRSADELDCFSRRLRLLNTLTISGHARLPSDSCGNYHNICPTEGLLQTVV